MKIEVNPRSLKNLQDICEVLYCLHPSVLNYLVEERKLGKVLGGINLDQPISLEEREYLYKLGQNRPKTKIYNFSNLNYEDILKTKDLNLLTEDDKMDLALSRYKDESKYEEINNLLKYFKLNTNEYITINFYVEVPSLVYGYKIEELVNALEKTRAPEEF